MVRVEAPAKINLSLGVGPIGDDGFHPLTTVFAALDLRDVLTLAPADDLTLQVSGVGADLVPTGPDNLAARAFALMAERFELPTPGATLTLDKSIPVAGGMAGGSADAAATLVAVDAWAGLGLTSHELVTLAAELGSDVPFCVVGGVQLGTGRGHLLEPVASTGSWTWVIAVVSGGLSTPTVYRRFDELHPEGCSLEPPSALIDAVAAGDVASLAAHVRNDLADAAVDLRPELGDVLDAGKRHGALASMVSGSGPTCAFLCDGPDAATHLARALEAEDAVVATHVTVGPVPGARVVEERR